MWEMGDKRKEFVDGIGRCERKQVGGRGRNREKKIKMWEKGDKRKEFVDGSWRDGEVERWKQGGGRGW